MTSGKRTGGSPVSGQPPAHELVTERGGGKIYASGKVTLATSRSTAAAEMLCRAIGAAIGKVDGAARYQAFAVSHFNCYLQVVSAPQQLHLQHAHRRLTAFADGGGGAAAALGIGVDVTSSALDAVLKLDVLLGVESARPRRVRLAVAYTGVVTAKAAQSEEDIRYLDEHLLRPTLLECVRDAAR